ncbi:heavy-metal-associated domain-containing protein [Kocuria coralli]|uniref:Heavy-metal-associated domain-containing protein n=1 Tax=Kocuria coralli TaxID=1461025 RepID=A0A5J5KTJ4_9MICC|nr:heavy-metal-associated domain-containing protein [Kocuria coralli]KAA9393049.1 heavy-metal-associated domain-containing protein [Kocuria coralli]
MKAPVRLGLYGLVLVIVFAVAGFTANAVVPEETVRSWAEDTEQSPHQAEGHGEGDDPEVAGGGGHSTEEAAPGLGIAEDGYRLTTVNAPAETGSEGELSLTVTGPDGNPVTDFQREHEEELHLIAVRADGQHFRHVHPEMNADGTWSAPWEWDAAGSYRVFADFVPGETGDGVTLSTTVQVAGDYTPAPAGGTVTEASVDGFDVDVTGDLVAGEASELTLNITRDGQPVTGLQPYLGAFGHLVALRDGDLAYLHVHPQGNAPQGGETSGPEIVFEATAPTEGRYLLYLDFQVDGQVHTAPLVLDTTTGSGTADESGAEHEEGAGHDH